jgi:hypothetical protein
MPYREFEYESRADRFDLPDSIQQLRTAWQSIPPDVKSSLLFHIRQLWAVRGPMLARLAVTAYSLMRQGVPMKVALPRAASQLGIPRRPAGSQPGLSTTQVKQYRQRQMQRLPARKPVYNRRRR